MGGSGEPDIVVTGLHRSGTTFVGDTLARAGLFQIFEPFNRDFGAVGVDRWKPHPETRTRDGLLYGELLGQLLTDCIRYKPALQTHNPLLRLAGRTLGLHRRALAYELGLLRQRLRPRRRLFKDPDLLFCADVLARRYGCQVVILVRHPCAFYQSLRRLDWRFPLEDVTGQPALVERHLSHLHEHLAPRERSFAEEAAVLWLCCYSAVADFLDANDALIALRHEDLALRPLPSFARLFERLGLRWTPRIAQGVRAATEGSRTAARAGRVHDAVRDSRALAFDWTRRLDAGEAKQILEITAPLLPRFYPEDESEPV